MAGVNVAPGAANPTHHLSLSDGTEEYGFVVEGGWSRVRRVPDVPSTLNFTGGGTKFGDYGAGLSHIEQRTWQGGRGQEELVDDPTRYFDGQNVWTLTPGRLTLGPSLIHARGIRTCDQFTRAKQGTTSAFLRHFVWVAAYSAARGYACAFLAGANYNADKAYLWVRRVGQPGTLTFTLRSDSSQSPGSVLQTVTYAASDFADVLSVFKVFDWSSTQALTSGTRYWLTVVGASTDNAANHWEIGCNNITPISGSNSVATSSDGSSWSASDTGRYFYFRVVDADYPRKWLFFELDGALYAVDVKANGSASSLFINGTRGIATAATSTTLTDTDNSYSVHANAWVKIIRGTGAGQARQVTTGGALSSGITVSAWDTTPSTDSEYVVYATDQWTEIGSTGLGAVKAVAVQKRAAYFAHGAGDPIRQMEFTPGSDAHSFQDDSTNEADLLCPGYIAASGPVLYRAVNGTTVQVSRADDVAYNSDHTFGTGIDIGSTDTPIMALEYHDNKLFVRKTDSLWYVDDQDDAYQVAIGLDTITDPAGAQAILSKDLFLYFSWAFSVEQYVGDVVNDVGYWKGAGLPYNRRGPAVDLENGIGVIYAAVDAGTAGISSVLQYDGQGWHPLVQGWNAGERIQSVRWQSCQGTRPRLWVSINGEIAFCELALDGLDPLQDLQFPFAHEGVLEQSSVDMGAAALEKLYRRLTVVADNLGDATDSGIVYPTKVWVDYQADSDIGTTTWYSLGQAYASPASLLKLNLGGRRALRLRFRLEMARYSAGGSKAYVPIIKGTVVDGAARTPFRLQWAVPVSLGNEKNLAGGAEEHPSRVLRWLDEIAAGTKRVAMRSVWGEMNGKEVFVEPVPLTPRMVSETDGQGRWQGECVLLIREQ